MSPKLARRIDPEDVVQSAYRSFFAKAGQDRFVLKRSGDLWRLLAAITMNKLGKQIERNQAAKRAVSAEDSIGPTDTSVRAVRPEALAADPTPTEAAAVVDEVALLMQDLSDVQRRMLELRLVGHTLEEIANETERSERTVRRLFGKLKVQLEDRLALFGNA